MTLIMTNTSRESSAGPLPLKQNLKLAYILSLLIALLMTAASVLGILYRNVIYPGEDLSIPFISNDILNLALVLPILLGSLWLANHGRLMGLLCWPGALFYVLYTFTAYLLGLPFQALSLFYLSLVMLSAYAIIVIVARIDRERVKQQLAGAVPVRTAGGILVGITLIFFIYQIAAIITALLDQRPVGSMQLAQWIDDLVVASPPLFMAGLLMLKRRAFGYVAGTGLLLVCSMLFMGLVPFMVVRAQLSNTPLNATDILVVLVSGLICFIPFPLFLRGTSKC
jgi:hypothetical protein